MVPPAPGRLSITMGWPIDCDIAWATARATTSVALPGVKATTTWIGFSG